MQVQVQVQVQEWDLRASMDMFSGRLLKGRSLSDVCAHLLLTMLAVHGLASWQVVLLAALQASRQAVCCVLGMHVGALHVACDAFVRLKVTLSVLAELLYRQKGETVAAI